jgi:hypothetical protein
MVAPFGAGDYSFIFRMKIKIQTVPCNTGEEPLVGFFTAISTNIGSVLVNDI